MRTSHAVMLAVLILCAPVSATAQAVAFDFESAPLHSPFPIDLTVDGITAHFSATGQGFSIQEANTMGFTPAGFAGYCIYPSSVFAADLLVGLSRSVTSFSILYAPQELDCDSSARMRITAYQDGALVGTSTTTADPPGTWPSATLSFSSPAGFNSVVIHYDAPPPTGGDWGPIFMADNMMVVPLGPEPASPTATPTAPPEATPTPTSAAPTASSTATPTAGALVPAPGGSGAPIGVILLAALGLLFPSLPRSRPRA